MEKIKKIYSFVKQYSTFRIITNSAADKVSSNSLSAFEPIKGLHREQKSHIQHKHPRRQQQLVHLLKILIAKTVNNK